MNSINNAVNLIQNRKLEDAERLCLQITASDTHASIDIEKAYILLATIREMQNRFEESLGYLDQTLEINDRQLGALRKYGQILCKLSKPEMAVDKFRAALDLSSVKPIMLELGQALVQCDDDVEAEKVFKEALQIDSNCHVSLRQLAGIAYKNGRVQEFIGYIELTRKLSPKDPRLILSLLMAYMESSALEKALALCESEIPNFPSLCPLYAMKYIVLAEMGEVDKAREVMHYDSLLKRIPAVMSDNSIVITELNNRLIHHVKNSAMKATDSSRYTTRFGWQTEHGKLFENNIELGNIVENMIRQTVDKYIAMLPDDPEHPVNLSRPQKFTIESWCVVLNTKGHQAPHIHPNAWLSGVYYIKLPDDFDDQPVHDAGRIVFGKGKEGLHHVDSPESITLKPVEGDFIMFPAYFWHHTIPSESEDERICLAFNVVPDK